MLLSVTDAATILGLSPRAVRARLAKGELSGRKVGGQWQVLREKIPLPAEAHAELGARADEIRAQVEAVLPSQGSLRRDSHHRSLADLAAFRVCRAVRLSLGPPDPFPGAPAARACLERALLHIADGWVQFDPSVRIEVLTQARSEIGHSLAHLLASTDRPPREAISSVEALEREALPAIAGMLRGAERRQDRR